MMRFYNDAKALLENTRCPVHKKKPKISVLNGNISISCCCDAFETECFENIKQLLDLRLIPKVTTKKVTPGV